MITGGEIIVITAAELVTVPAEFEILTV